MGAKSIRERRESGMDPNPLLKNVKLLNQAGAGVLFWNVRREFNKEAHKPANMALDESEALGRFSGRQA